MTAKYVCDDAVLGESLWVQAATDTRDEAGRVVLARCDASNLPTEPTFDDFMNAGGELIHLDVAGAARLGAALLDE